MSSSRIMFEGRFLIEWSKSLTVIESSSTPDIPLVYSVVQGVVLFDDIIDCAKEITFKA